MNAKDVKLTISEPSYGTLLTQQGIALHALRSIVLHADMPDGESWEQAYIEVTSMARDALAAIDARPAGRHYMAGGQPKERACTCGRAPDPGIKPEGGCWCREDDGR